MLTGRRLGHEPGRDALADRAPPDDKRLRRRVAAGVADPAMQEFLRHAFRAKRSSAADSAEVLCSDSQ